MKKNYLKMCITLFITILVIPGCRKETNYDTELRNKGGWGDHKDDCRLVSDISEFDDLTYTYNRRGLVDQWTISALDGYYEMEYNERGRLVKSRFYSAGALVNTIVFFYRGDRVVKETWYDGDTQVKVDEVFYTFNWYGKVIKAQSFLQDYVSIYKYTPDGGSVAGWDLYVGGIINYSQLLTYLPPHHKEPDLARPGLDYDFAIINGRISQSRWYSTSEKDISYDTNGLNPQVLVDQDPTKSVIAFNRHNYITATDFFDNLTQDYVHFKFDYENCGSDDGDNATPASKSLGRNNNKTTLQKFLKLGSSKSIKDQVKDFKTQYLIKQ